MVYSQRCARPGHPRKGGRLPLISNYSPRHGKRGRDKRPRRTNRIAVWNVLRHSYKSGQCGNPRGRPRKVWTRAIDMLYRAAHSAELRKQIGELALTNPKGLRAEARRFMRRGPNRQWR